MAGLEAKPKEKQRKSKRKLRPSNDDDNHQRDSKTTRHHETTIETNNQNHDGLRVWDNLDLILSLQNKKIHLQRKIELAFGFITSTKLNKERDNLDFDFEQNTQTVSFPRLITVLTDWVQSLLISSATQEACLDFRCWEIFKFCMEECPCLGITPSISPNLLRSLAHIARNALSMVDKDDGVVTDEDCRFHSLLCDCVVILFSHHGKLLNPNVDLWVSLVTTVVELVGKIYSVNTAGDDVGLLLLRFSNLVLEPFAKFLRVHPSPKNIFPVFVDKLLEQLLSLMAVLYSQIDNSRGNLLRTLEDILSNGLFHPVHIDGFLTAYSYESNVESNAVKLKNSRAIVKSYHRHFFLKLEQIMSEKVSALEAIGRLFHLFVVKVKKQKGVLVQSEAIENAGKISVSGVLEKVNTEPAIKLSVGDDNTVSKNTSSAIRLDAETSKSIFGIFVHFLEPLLLKVKNYSEVTLEGENDMRGSLSSLKSINEMLSSFMKEKIFARTEDDSEGTRLKILKDIFQTIISFSAKVHSFWSSSLETGRCNPMNVLPLLTKEVIRSFGYFLEIEYEIIENDLVCLWLILFIYSEIDLSVMNTPAKCLLIPQMWHLASQLINTYSELRQVHKPIFALCKAIRLFGFCDKDNDLYSKFITCKSSTSFEISVQSVTMLLCSQDFRLAISSAIASIPEGQVGGSIRQLQMDISDSLEWLKDSCPMDHSGSVKSDLPSGSVPTLHRQIEFFGRFLSETYTLILDHSAVTPGNSILVGNSIKDLMVVLKPLSSLVEKQENGVSSFLCSVMGRKFHKMSEGKGNMPTLGSSSIWILLFFFRVYMSCRSLFRQSISLMPPDSSKKTSRAMGDLLTAYCGYDWMHGIDTKSGGYFSWMTKRSDSFPNIIRSVSDTFLGGSMEDCAQLIYVLLSMSFQRLRDLNREIKAFDFLVEKVARMARVKLMKDDVCEEQSFSSKDISVLRQEAIDITEFVMRFLPLIEKKIESVSKDKYVEKEGKGDQMTHDTWDLSVCSLTEKSLSTAIWWIFCQNTDTWCNHATKKKLRKFTSCLLQSSTFDVGNQKMDGLHVLRRVSMRQISLALLGDTIFHEEQSLCRHLTSQFCHLLEKSVLVLFNDSFDRDVEMNSIPNWREVLCKLEVEPAVLNKGHADDNSGMVLDVFPAKLSSMESRKHLVMCQNLLSLLSWLPRGHMNEKYFSGYATYILSLERLLVFNILYYHGKSCLLNQSDLIGLFIYSRRALKCLVMAYCDEKIENGHSLLIPILCENRFSILWLLKSVSVVVQCLHASSEELVSQVKHMNFSLMDHTSYLFLTLSKIQYRCAVSSLFRDEVTLTELPLPNEPSDHVSSVDPSEACDVWKVVVLMAETLKEQTQNLVPHLKAKLQNAEVGTCFDVVDFNKISSMISSLQGFLWGLASVLSDIDLRCTEEKKQLRWKFPRKLFLCMDEFEDFLHFCLYAIAVDESLSGQERDKACDLASDVFDECNNSKRSESDSLRSSKTRKKMSQLVDAIIGINSLNDFDSFGRLQLKIPLLQSLLSGELPELAFLIREILTASSAILGLKLKTGHRSKTKPNTRCCKSSSSMRVFVWTSQFLLSEFAEMTKEPDSFSFVWLDGAIKYTEVLGSYISLVETAASKKAYNRLINIHLGAIGRCISLQGKGATLASHESESRTKTLRAQSGSSKVTLVHGPYSLDEFKARLRTSFIILIQKPHLLSAMKTLERALVGVQEGCTMVYEINTGVPDGGKVSPIVAAGVDCFDMLLDSVSGCKRLDDIKSYTEHLIGALFNIILHLHDPHIFYGKVIVGEGSVHPDPGSVTLMCVEVLTKVSGKPSLFQMHCSHISQSLQVPAALFQDFLLLRSQTTSNSIADCFDPRPIAGSCSDFVDQQFSVDLFAACCRLLCTVLRHRKSESERCMSILQSSVCVLLHCLETATIEGNFTLKLQEGIKCASFLRRIYEEIRQQKEVLRSYCSHFLSNYITVYSGHGPCKTGIKREIDDALRPGIYALMDACSPEDLQQLHSGLGEGTCRSTLSDLRRDYKQNFQYEGKV